ncbi:MAG: hypothetical protein ACRD0U_03040, partial [Acidimicrobiales bacterium]
MTATRRFEMQSLVRETQRWLRASPMFALYVLVTLAYAGFIGLMVAQMTWRLDVVLPGGFGQMAHGASGPHRVHDLTFALLMTTGVVGVLAQLRRPSMNVAGMMMALIPFAALALAGILAGEFEVVARRNPARAIGPIVAVAALLHPKGRSFFRSFRISRVNWVMVALVGIAAVPFLPFASTNIRLQETVRDEHFIQGHYGFMAAFSFTVIGVGLLASVRPDGWRLTAWVAGLLPALVGVWSVLFPDATSSLGLGWALAAIAWGAVLIAAAELTKNAEGSTLLGSPRGDKVATSAQSEPAAQH